MSEFAGLLTRQRSIEVPERYLSRARRIDGSVLAPYGTGDFATSTYCPLWALGRRLGTRTERPQQVGVVF